MTASPVEALLLTGRDLSPEALAQAARPGGRVALSSEGLERMTAARPTMTTGSSTAIS